MKKINRSDSFWGLVIGAGLIALLPAAFAQDSPLDPPSTAGGDTDIQHSAVPPSLPMAAMPMPSFSPPMPQLPPIPGAVSMEGTSPDLIGMRGDSDVMMLGAAVHGGFSDDQLEKIFKLKSEYMSKAGPKMAELKSLEMSLYDTLTQPEVDKGKAQSIQSKINSLRNDLADLKLEQRVGLVGTLSSDQHKELRRSFLKHVEFGSGMMGRSGRWGHHGGSWHHGGGSCGSRERGGQSEHENKEQRQTSVSRNDKS